MYMYNRAGYRLNPPQSPLQTEKMLFHESKVSFSVSLCLVHL